MRLSVLGLMFLVLLAAACTTLFVGLREEALCYITGPHLGSLLAALLVPRDRSALVSGASIGGLCQGVVSVLLLGRGYPFGDPAMLTGPLYVAALGVHLLAGLGFGVLLFLALQWSRPKSGPGGPPQAPAFYEAADVTPPLNEKLSD
ncbi:hypothetical protein [Paludisphaera mucosa]|uniref:Uncharacterized protein n=1 Tax=Paludisphaera mucosa TaxID=3030827 RepID=A0ABT6FKP1_9BACT|nr:hypothetical protein [Paludisphaera mucosa]MDG3008145.1 hypothetical protein [Paludisphaera mucosa]